MIKRATLFFALSFTLVTVLSISSFIMVMTFDYQDTDNSTEIVSQQAENQQQEYWTEKRMEEAKPAPMATVSNIDKYKKIVEGSLPMLIILFIIFTFAFTLINMRKVKLLEKQNKEIIELLNRFDR